MNKDLPKVSVVTITYGHEKFITETLDGVLMQQYPGPVEFIIANDNSPDATDEVVKKYFLENPVPSNFEIKYTKHETNKGMMPNFIWALQQATGKYIALCEGDDYWTDPSKLQKQFDYLEKNPDCSLCFHAYKRIINNDENSSIITRAKNVRSDNKFETKDAILGGGGFMGTNSMFFLSKFIQNIPQWMITAPVGDLPLMLLLASKGKIGYIDDVMSTYRVSSSSAAWSVNLKKTGNQKDVSNAVVEMWNNFDEWTNFKYHKYIKKRKRIGRRYDLQNRIVNYIKHLLKKLE